MTTRAALETSILNAMAAADGHPMQWGVDDCALWVANALRDPLGYDPAAKVRGRYKTRRGSQRVAGRTGLVGQIRGIARRHDWQRIAPVMAQAGDVGMAWTNGPAGKPVLATVVCRRRGWFVGRNEMGFSAIAADRVAVAWSVLPDALSTEPGARAFLRHPMRPGIPMVVQEPVSTFIGLTSLIASLGVSTAVAGAVGGFIVSATLSIGLSLVSSLLQPHNGSSLGNNSTGDASAAQGAQITERQSLPFKRVIVGRAYVGGALFYESVTPPYLTMGVLINYGEIDGIEASFVGTDELQFSELVPSAILTPTAVAGQPAYSTHLKVSFRYGASDQAADLLILSGLSAVPGSTGTIIGDMTNPSAAFDGVTSKVSGASAYRIGVTTAHIGKQWSAPKTIGYFSFTVAYSSPGPNNLLTYGGSVALQGSNDGSTWTTLRSTGVPGPMPSTSFVVQGAITTNAYSYHRVEFAITATGDPADDSILIAQVVFYEQISAQSTLAEFRQRGIATGVYRCDYGTDQTAFLATWGQVQRPTFYNVVRGVVCYDPRDPTQSQTDATTWKWTNNAALVQTWYLTRPFGGRVPMSKIRWDKTILSANWDDSLMGCNDGTTIAKHTIDGVVMLNQQPFQVMQDMLKSNRGMLLESGGRVWVQSSYPKSPVVTIHDRILAGGLDYKGGKARSDMANKVQVRFVAPNQDYQVVDGPILSRSDLQAVDGEVLPATLALNYTLDHRRAQRLQKAFLASARLGRSITCTVDLRLMAIAAQNGEELVGSVVTVNSVLFPNANGNYMVTAVGFADDCTTLALALTEYDPIIDTNWNPETDEKPFVLATF